MEENLLLRAAIVCSIIGVIALYLISGSIEISETSIDKITSGESGSDSEVLVLGKVARITEKEGFMVIEIEKTESIPVFVFKDDPLLGMIDISKGDKIEVRGLVQDYKGKNEIVAEEMRMV